jgi:hypothetical protein
MKEIFEIFLQEMLQHRGYNWTNNLLNQIPRGRTDKLNKWKIWNSFGSTSAIVNTCYDKDRSTHSLNTVFI